VDPTSLATELTPGLSVTELWKLMVPIDTESADEDERRRRLGRLALDAHTVEEPVRRWVVSARFGGIDWEGDRVSVVACEATTGLGRVFDGASSVDVVDAVAASGAVPGVWRPVTIDDSRHIDDGIWSLTNSDLATGRDLVLVPASLFDQAMDAELAGLGPGVQPVVNTADEASIAAFGTDVLDPTVREPSARAGMAQGLHEAERIAPLLAGRPVARPTD
jgi:NTE family protein